MKMNHSGPEVHLGTIDYFCSKPYRLDQDYFQCKITFLGYQCLFRCWNFQKIIFLQISLKETRDNLIIDESSTRPRFLESTSLLQISSLSPTTVTENELNPKVFSSLGRSSPYLGISSHSDSSSLSKFEIFSNSSDFNKNLFTDFFEIAHKLTVH